MKIQKQFRVAAIIIMAIGLIHTTATPLVLTSFKVLPRADYLTFAYMFVVTGMAVFLNGLIQYFIVKQQYINQLSFTLLKFNTLFMFCIAVGAVASMYDSFNPFAYIMLLTAIWEIILLRKLKIDKNE